MRCGAPSCRKLRLQVSPQPSEYWHSRYSCSLSVPRAPWAGEVAERGHDCEGSGHSSPRGDPEGVKAQMVHSVGGRGPKEPQGLFPKREYCLQVKPYWDHFSQLNFNHDDYLGPICLLKGGGSKPSRPGFKARLYFLLVVGHG